MKISARAALQRFVTYPFISPFMLAYLLTKNAHMLDKMYSIRSLPHGAVLNNGMRIAKYNGKRIFFPSREDPNFDDVYLRNVYFAYRPLPQDVVYDIGAHMGFFMVKIASQVKTVVAFEPDKYNFNYLLMNIRNNKLNNVVAQNFAVGEEDTTLFLNMRYGHGRTTLTSEKTDFKVKVKKIDSIVKENEITPNIIKIDTEGYELNVLKGAKITLAQNKPRLIIAAYHYPNEAKEIIDYLVKIGYRCYQYSVPYTLQKVKEEYVYAEHIKENNKN